jgi:hypothetical protein
MVIKEFICLKCKNLTPNADEDGSLFCLAFPNREPWTPEELKQRYNEGITLDPKGIPDEIIFGENDHSIPLQGQTGDFVFTEGTPVETPPPQQKMRAKII